MLLCIITFHINFAGFPARDVFPPSNDQNPGLNVCGKQCNTLSLLNKNGTCGEPFWLHNEGNVPKDDEQDEALDERVQAPEGHSSPPFTATHGSVSEKGGIQEEHMFPGALSSM